MRDTQQATAPAQASVRNPSWIPMVSRIVVLTVVITFFFFAIGLLFGIVGTAIVDVIRGGTVNMALAYRRIAFPFAMVVLVITFPTVIVMEVRRYVRAKEEYRQALKAR